MELNSTIMSAGTHELAPYTLRFLGDRAKVNEARTATMLKQTRAAAAAAAVKAAKKIEVVEQKQVLHDG